MSSLCGALDIRDASREKSQPAKMMQERIYNFFNYDFHARRFSVTHH
jgi:hypothetical protein